MSYAFSICCGLPVALIALFLVGLWLDFQYTRRFNRRFVHHLRTRFGRGFNVNELARRLRIAPADLLAIIPQYREKRVPKRSGGMRTLHIPGPPLMAVQRKILRLLLAHLRAHDAAHAFERRRSIVTNALPHAGRAILVKLDIRDFFDTTSATRVDAYFRRVGWNAQAAALLTRLVTHQNGLPQGAPTSPRLANLLNIRLDARLTKYLKSRFGIYTRYADDITISFRKDIPSRNRGVIERVRCHVQSLGYELNTKKTRILRPHQQKCVTGLVINATPNLPRAVRKRLRAIRHHLATGKAATLTLQQLAGWTALEQMIRIQSQPGKQEPPAVKP